MAADAPPPDANSERELFYRRIDGANLAPLWEVLHALVPPQPASPCQPAIWKWQAVQPWVIESGRIISAREAERRVLVLENPALRGRSRITPSLYAGLQLVLPGEIAPAHRHTQSALRFVLSGAGAYTAVDGERVTMQPGDFIITPSWTWHDHGNPSAEPIIWMDVLDIPIVELLGAQFMERHAREAQPTARTQGESQARFGHNMLPPGYSPRSRASPMFCYPYARSREALAVLARGEPPHPVHGHRLQYTNPATGGSAMPTIGAFLQWLPAGFSGRRGRASDATVCCVVEGGGSLAAGDTMLDFGPRDIFVIPSWTPFRWLARSDCVIFSASDRPVQQALDLWREIEE